MKLSAKKIEKHIKNLKVHSFDFVDSTNTVAKKMATAGEFSNTLVIAECQTAGKGRLGRTFLSEKGGLYFSLLLRPQISPEETLFITTAAAAAVCRAIESVSDKKCEIKWVNDVYISGKKVCGILTEGEFNADGTFNYAVLGVGINLFMPAGGFPADLPLAGAVFDKKFRKNRIKEKVLINFLDIFFSFFENLSEKKFIDEYQKRSLLDGRQISYEKDGRTITATVVKIDKNARLVVKNGEETVFLTTGEVQITEVENLFKDKK